MGNICTTHFEREDQTQTADNISKNLVLFQVSLGETVKIDIVQGNQKQHRGETLLIITSQSHYQQCESIRDYCPDADKVLEIIANSRKVLVKCNPYPNTRNNTPQYRNVLVCVMPEYKSQDSQNYQIQFRNVVKEVISTHKDISVQFSQTMEGYNTLPNQMIIALLLRQLSMEKSGVNPPKANIKITLIGNDKKMINLIKYELLKIENCVLSSQSKEISVTTF